MHNSPDMQVAQGSNGKTSHDAPTDTGGHGHVRLPEALRADDAQYVMRPWADAGAEPVPFVDGKGLYVRDADGRTYMDFTAGYFVNQAGHCHPRIVAAATRQLTRIAQVGGRHASEPAVGLARRLAALAPGQLRKSMFTTGGAEANEFAIKMVRQAAGRPGIGYLANAFHGLSHATLSACGSESYRKSASAPLDPAFVALPNAYCYRCPHAADCRTQCVDRMAAILDAEPDVGALLAEPVQGVGGLAPPAAWWQRVDALRRERGLLLILDEVQTGVGRTGTMFAAERYGLEPDVLVLAKGISGGVGSLGAVMATPAVADRFFGATSPTSAGNAVSCAAGAELLDVIRDEGLCANATAMGARLTRAIRALDLPWVGDIRFTGLMGGVELVTDRATRTPLDKPVMRRVKERFLECGVVVTVSGPLGNVIRLQPPLNVTAAQVDAFVVELQRVLVDVCARRG